MKKSKKLILSFLALNAALPISAAGTESAATSKYDRLYNNIVKNIETGKSNDTNYKLIENVLNQRNKELKDLYLQSDYIIKPEYLEWQIFFSGFFGQTGGLKQCICRFIPPVQCQNVYVHHRSDMDEFVDFVTGELTNYFSFHLPQALW